MSRSLVIAVLCSLAGFVASGNALVRNPFWPQEYNGRRHRIDITPRYPSTPVETVAETDSGNASGTRATKSADSTFTAQDAENAMWHDARATLRFSDPCNYEKDGEQRQCLRINGRLYETGDLISINHGPHRFTWVFQGFGTNNTVRLSRIHHRELSEQERNSKLPLTATQGN